MRKLLYAATVAGASLLPAAVAQAQCPCGNGYYGYGQAYFGSTTLPPAYYGYAAPAYYGYAAPGYQGYDDGSVEAYYRGWGAYGVAAARVALGYYGYGARVGLDQFAYGQRATGVRRIGWRGGGYGNRHTAHRRAPAPPPTLNVEPQPPTQEGAD